MKGRKKPKDVEEEAIAEIAEVIPEEVIIEKKPVIMEHWNPKTDLGKKVKAGVITNIDDILNHGFKILESEIVDVLLPNLEHTLLSVGQSKGKFGGGKKSIWKQTQKKTNEGNKPKFATLAVVGDKNGHIGIGYGKAKETVPAREKAVRNAKLNLINIKLGCGSWACNCHDLHSIPFKVYGRCGSVRVYLLPAPKGTRLSAETEVQKLLSMAGIKDVYSQTFGQTRTKINLIYACFIALKNISTTKRISIIHQETK